MSTAPTRVLHQLSRISGSEPTSSPSPIEQGHTTTLALLLSGDSDYAVCGMALDFGLWPNLGSWFVSWIALAATKSEEHWCSCFGASLDIEFTINKCGSTNYAV